MMAQYFDWEDCRCTVYGGAFLAGGGGGGIEGGLAMINGLAEKYPDFRLPVISAEEMGDDQYSCVFGGIAAPSAVAFDGVLELFVKLMTTGYESARRIVPNGIHAVMPPEAGAMCFPMAVIPCIANGLPLLDADGCDRAAPGLDCCLYTLNGIPFYPSVLSTSEGHVLRVESKDPLSADVTEKVARQVLPLFENVLGMVCWYSSKKDVLEKLVCGTVTKAREVGKALLEAKKAGTSILEAVGRIIPVRLLAEGVVTDLRLNVSGGHDLGCTTIRTDEGKLCYVDFANENLVIRTDDEVLMTCPDVICCVDDESYCPLSSMDIRVGQRVQYIATPVSGKWFDNDRPKCGFEPYFEMCGYKGDVVRY